DAGACEPVAALGRLVRIRRGSDRHRVVPPGWPRELGTQDFGHVHLDPDRAPVLLTRGAVRAQLVRPDVAERAAVRAAHVGVQRPVEGHPADPIERRSAGLLAVLDAHDPKYRTHVRTRKLLEYFRGRSRASGRHPPPDLSAPDEAGPRALLPP